VGLYGKCTRALTFQNMCHELVTVGLYNKCTRALSFQNVCHELVRVYTVNVQGH
jgi:hypothetical protein